MSGASAAEAILANPDYASLKAVQDQQVYGTPNTPFSWMDRPMGPNRIVGIRWLSGPTYPEYLNYNVDEEVKEFFDWFYDIQLTDEAILQWNYISQIDRTQPFGFRHRTKRKGLFC